GAGQATPDEAVDDAPGAVADGVQALAGPLGRDAKVRAGPVGAGEEDGLARLRERAVAAQPGWWVGARRVVQMHDHPADADLLVVHGVVGGVHDQLRSSPEGGADELL